jgi:hypothetical protein
MLVPALKGGLCNQLFTIAATYSKSIDLNCEMAINYNLPHYAMQGFTPDRYRDNLYKNIPETNYVPAYKYSEPTWSFTPLPDCTDMLIDGYLQSGKYFKNNLNKIRDLFYFPENIKNKIWNFLAQFNNKKIIGMHVRRGDYLASGCRERHFLCTYEYFKQALQNFPNEYIKIVCTDDIQNCQDILQIPNTYIMENNTEIEDLFLISQCDNVIMSNSSFSWWGHFLGKQKETVVAPTRWFTRLDNTNFQDIYEESWILVPV